MKPDHFYPEHNLFLEMAEMKSSDRVTKITANLVLEFPKIKNGTFPIYLFVTSQKIYLAKILSAFKYLIFHQYLLLLVKIFSQIWDSERIQVIPPLHQKSSDLYMRI